MTLAGLDKPQRYWRTNRPPQAVSLCHEVNAAALLAGRAFFAPVTKFVIVSGRTLLHLTFCERFFGQLTKQVSHCDVAFLDSCGTGGWNSDRHVRFLSEKPTISTAHCNCF